MCWTVRSMCCDIQSRPTMFYNRDRARVSKSPLLCQKSIIIPYPFKSPDNIEAVRAWNLAIPANMRLSLHSLSPILILHENLHYHLHKLVIVQKHSEHDLNSRREAILVNVLEDAAVLFSSFSLE